MDLSVGTPVDPVPPVVRAALTAAADSPGYRRRRERRSCGKRRPGWLARRHGVTVDPGAVLPVIGTKEFIAALPALLGCGPGDTVVHPELAYPTYEIGARLAGARAGGGGRAGHPRATAGGAAVGELPGQPDRPGAARGAPAEDGGLGS